MNNCSIRHNKNKLKNIAGNVIHIAYYAFSGLKGFIVVFRIPSNKFRVRKKCLKVFFVQMNKTLVYKETYWQIIPKQLVYVFFSISVRTFQWRYFACISLIYKENIFSNRKKKFTRPKNSVGIYFLGRNTLLRLLRKIFFGSLYIQYYK